MAVWQDLLCHSIGLLKTGSAQAVDATGFDRQDVSRHYANRVNYSFESVKTAARGLRDEPNPI